MEVLSKIIEVTELNLESATKLAAEKLGVTPQDLTVTVLEEKKKLFGREQVRIRAEIIGQKEEGSAEVSQDVPTEALELEPEVVSQETKEPKESKAFLANDEDAAFLKEQVEKIVEESQLKIHVKLKALSGRYVQFELEGEDVSYMLERNGQPLNALQFIMNGIAARQLSTGARVTFDASQYRSKREGALHKLAVRIAEEVKERKEEAVLDELPAFERRIIHQALENYPGIVTYSEGEEPHRCVVIAIKD